MTPPAQQDMIPLFEIEGTYYFKHYFEDDDIFNRLTQFYDNDEYRFEVPENDLETVGNILQDGNKTPRLIDDPDEYVVVRQKYTRHPDILFKQSVLKRDTPDNNLFLMKDKTAVEAAITNGATALAETDLSFEP